MLSSAALKARFKASLDEYPESTRIRLHRALSWLSRSEQEFDDPDARFLFLWVAFNAAYARELEEPTSERAKLNGFLEKLVAMDDRSELKQLVHEAYSGSIRLLLDNHFVFEPFWRALREHDSSGRWEESFAASKRVALQHFMAGNTATTLAIVFDRLYVLRNQLVHGGATWSSRLNRQQVKDASQLMGELVPTILDIMLDSPMTNHGDLLYPVVGNPA